MRRRYRALMDMSKPIRAGLEAGRKEIIVRTMNEQRDTRGRAFAPLADSTLERKMAKTGHPLILHDAGAMLAVNTFKFNVGKRRGVMYHAAPSSRTGPGGGSRTRYARQTRTGRTRMHRYDYGLAHQRSKQARLPQRKWWLELNTSMGKMWARTVYDIFLNFLQRGTVA